MPQRPRYQVSGLWPAGIKSSRAKYAWPAAMESCRSRSSWNRNSCMVTSSCWSGSSFICTSMHSPAFAPVSASTSPISRRMVPQVSCRWRYSSSAAGWSGNWMFSIFLPFPAEQIKASAAQVCSQRLTELRPASVWGSIIPEKPAVVKRFFRPESKGSFFRPESKG